MALVIFAPDSSDPSEAREREEGEKERNRKSHVFLETVTFHPKREFVFIYKHNCHDFVCALYR